MDRGCITYSTVYIAGILLAQTLSPTWPACAAILAILLISALFTRNNTKTFLLVSHLAMFCAGTGAYAQAKENENLPPDKFSAYIKDAATAAQEKASLHFKKIVPDYNSHSILCALTVGKKDNIDKSLKDAYSTAGAIHILALSGLHVGIIYSILEKILTPLTFLPGGKGATIAVSLLLLLIYCIFSGCSPSVIRACTMIFIYKIAAGSFRNTGKWDALALSALVIGIIAPLQTCTIGFQLSYAAVIGIAALFPVCRNAFVQIFGSHRIMPGFLYQTVLKFWESISISVGCQIAVLPLLLIYFGESAQYFIITNLIAIPLATLTLHLFVLTLAFLWLPAVGNILSCCLNASLEILNKAIVYISS